MSKINFLKEGLFLNKKISAGRLAIQLILSLVIVLFIISFSVVFTLNFRPLYYFDMEYLSISEMSGYTNAQIKENYNALIDYNSMFNHDPLNFPSLTMSENGRIHFEEVKEIFVAVQYICIFTFILGLAGILWQRRYQNHLYLGLTAILTIAIPLGLGMVISLNWEQSFVTFHHIFFDNDYWIFDAATDPVITILPDTFFFHCALMILAGILLGCTICSIFYFYFRKKEKNHAQETASN